MDTAGRAGFALTALATLGYVVGLTAPYPGRAFSVTGIMVGITLVAVGLGGGEPDDD